MLNKNVQGFEPDVLDTLKRYYWHGNLRELKNVVKRAVLLCQNEQIEMSCLPREIADTDKSLFNTNGKSGELDDTPENLKAVVEKAERYAILNALKKTNNNKTRTAQLLEVDRKTLYNKLKAYNIE
jgi:two-component system response regulator HydG